MLKRDKCMNCGNSINYNEVKNGVYVCPYCRTNYHIDKLGYIEEYKVKLMFMGHLLECYLQSYGMEPQYIETTTVFDNRRTYIADPYPEITLEFKGTFVDEVSNGEN